MKPFILALLLFSSAFTWAGDALKIFTLQHRFAEDLIPQISPLVGQNGTVTGINNQLIVRADEQMLIEIEKVVQQLDTARVNRRITVASDQHSTGQSSVVDANGRIIIGNRSRGNVNIDIDNRRTSRRQSAQQFINVLDGERAFIRVGQLVPFSQDWLVLTRRYAQYYRTTNWVDVSTGFAVRPRSIGNQVELEITPRISQLNSRNFIDFNTLSTTVRIGIGEWVDIGSLMQTKDEVSRKILGYADRYNTSDQSLKVKVD